MAPEYLFTTHASSSVSLYLYQLLVGHYVRRTLVAEPWLTNEVS